MVAKKKICRCSTRTSNPKTNTNITQPLKVLVVLINAHLASLAKPDSYAEEVKKGLRTANIP